MLRGKQIAELVELLNHRNVILYHSCQYIDFQSYLEIGGIPSRKKMSDEGKSLTKFETDQDDKKNAVWDKVFLNLHDFGEIFEQGNGIPTVYGPIHCLVKPEALLEAKDIAISLRSAGSQLFNRENEALKSVDDVERIFRYPANSFAEKRKQIKWIDELKNEFQKEYVSNPEISLTVASGVIPLSYIKCFKVDPYYFAGDELINHANPGKRGKQFGITAERRSYKPGPTKILKDITRLLLDKELTLADLAKIVDIAPETKKWAEKMMIKKDMGIQWRRYTSYLRSGTLLPIVEETAPKSDYGLYNCVICQKRVMGFSKDIHVEENHSGKFKWIKIN